MRTNEVKIFTKRSRGSNEYLKEPQNRENEKKNFQLAVSNEISGKGFLTHRWGLGWGQVIEGDLFLPTHPTSYGD